MKIYKIALKYFFVIGIFIFNALSNFAISESEVQDQNLLVSDRELLILSILAYNPDQLKRSKEMLNTDSFYKENFSNKVDYTEFEDWVPVDYIINKSERHMSGFTVITYKKDDSIVVAFKGEPLNTAPESLDKIIPIRENPQIKYVKQYANKIKHCDFMSPKTKIYITGYSLGGHLASYLTGLLLETDSLKDQLIKTVTFNTLSLEYPSSKKVLDALGSLPSEKLVHYICNQNTTEFSKLYFSKPIVLNSFNSVSQIEKNIFLELLSKID